MTKAVFITGTDTGVGKTFVAARMARRLRARGVDVCAMKPVSSGGDEDIKILMKACGIREEARLVNPYSFKEPVAPAVAARMEGKEVKLDVILKAFHTLKRKHEYIIVEGAGGLMVPLNGRLLVRDLIKKMNIPLIIVARPGLGTINHTALTVAAARSAGIKIKGIIINGLKKDRAGICEKTNPEVIEKTTGTKVLEIIPHIRTPGVRMWVHTDPRGPYGLKEMDKKYIWHPFTQMRDWQKDDMLVIEEGSGSYLKDTKGRRYLDGISSLWVNVHGHRKKEIDDAVKTQLDKIAHSTLLGLGNVPSILLAERLVKIVPKGLTKVFYSDNGSTAVEVALKIAYQYWQQREKPSPCGDRQKKKKKFIHLVNSYHGDTIGSVSVGGIDLFHKAYRPFLFDAIAAPAPYCYRCSSEKSCGREKLLCLRQLEKILRCRHTEIAGMIIEPVIQGAAGMLTAPRGYLKGVRCLCNRYKVLLIADEAATGFGRTGRMFACEQEGVSPDILCLAKSITGGYLPLAATLTTEKIYRAFLGRYQDKKTFFHGHTYTGNPLACAAALANLELFKKENTIEKLKPKIEYMRKRLKAFYAIPQVGEVRQAGMMAGIELVRDRATKKEFDWSEKIGIRVIREARRRGVVLRPLGNVIVLMPPLSITADELKRLLDVTEESIRAVFSL